MNNLLEKYLRAPMEGEGAAGAGGAAAGGAAAGGGATDPGAAAEAAAGKSAEGGAAGGAAGGAGGSPPPAATQPYRPDGLADTMFGKDDRETIDKMKTALDGYRQRDSSVPANIDGYAIDAKKLVTDLKLDAGVEPFLAQLGKDPLYKAVSDVALAEKVPAGTMQKIVGALYSEAMKAGILEPLVDTAAERAALLPEGAKTLAADKQQAAIDARMQANEDFIKNEMKPGADGKPRLDPKVGEHALLMLMDTAAGNQFIEWMRHQMTGGDRANPIGGSGGGQNGGADARAELAKRAALPQNMVGNRAFDQKSWEQLQEDYKKLIPEKK